MTILEGVEAALSRATLVRDGGAFVAVVGDRARRAAETGAAEAAAADPQPGALAGLTFAVKDVLALRGQPREAGSAARSHEPPEDSDATIVRALCDLGAVPIGRTATHELAFGVTGVNRHTGTPPNPADPARIPGGSSSGSAVAVAHGVVDVALGSDTGGSVRIPAALCGVVGFKPAFGEYPVGGLLPLAPSLDHVGLLARSVGTIRRVHTALGHPVAPSSQEPTLGLPPGWDDVDEAVRSPLRAAVDALADSGARLVEVAWPDLETSLRVSTAVMFHEAAQHLGPLLRARPEEVGEDVRHRIEYGMRLEAAAVEAARGEVVTLRQQVGRTLAEVDAVIGPTVATVAPRLMDADRRGVDARLVGWTCLLNLTGTAAVSLPVPGGLLPVGLQVAARTSAGALGVAGLVEEVLRPGP